MNKRASIIIGSIFGVLAAALSLGVSLGGLAPATAAAIGVFLGAVLPIAQGAVTSTQVFSRDSAKQLLRAPASDADPAAVIRTAKETDSTAAEVVVAKGLDK